MTFQLSMNDLQIGQLLMVETRDEVLIGNLLVFDPNCKIIELNNVRDIKTNYVYTSSQILQLPLVKTIKIMDTKIAPAPGNNNNFSACPSDSALHHNKPVCNPMILSSCELHLIDDQICNTIYISQTDRSYHKALADIKAETEISLLLEPMVYGRHNRTSIITIGTNRAVYIFDILTLGKVFPDMKQILESKSPRKVMHYSNRIRDNLKHRQNLDLTSVFDTFVAHCVLTGEKLHVNLLETILYYFSIPALYFSPQDCQTGTNSGPETMDPYLRPIAKKHLNLLAKKAIFQKKLYEHLLHDHMLSNFYQQCDQFSKSFSSTTDLVEAAMQLVPNSQQGFNNITPNQGWNEFLNKQF